jgi:hypothetical protein
MDVMKTRKVLDKAIEAVFMILCFTLISSSVYAQEEAESQILSLSEFTIKAQHDSQFRAGVKDWIDCYMENDGEWEWNMWRRVQGEGNVYVLSSFMSNWAEMDEDDEAGQECQSMVQNLIMPNIEKAEYNLARTIPELSKTELVENNVISVFLWRVKNGTLFRETVNEVESTIREVEGEPRGYWYSSIGGNTKAPHYFVVTPYSNFAAMDVEMDGVWTVVENEHGASKREQLQADYREAVEVSWSYLYRRDTELSRPMEE